MKMPGGRGDVIAVGLDAFTSALIETESNHLEMAHYINEYPIISEHFNEILGILFQMELTPSMKRLVIADYIVECIFYHDNDSFVEIISTALEGIINSQRKDRIRAKNTAKST
jgi:hypothetical protein